LCRQNALAVKAHVFVPPKSRCSTRRWHPQCGRRPLDVTREITAAEISPGDRFSLRSAFGITRIGGLLAKRVLFHRQSSDDVLRRLPLVFSLGAEIRQSTFPGTCKPPVNTPGSGFRFRITKLGQVGKKKKKKKKNTKKKKKKKNNDGREIVLLCSTI